MFDGDCDGKLSREHLVAAIKHMQTGQGAPPIDAPPTTLLAAEAAGNGVANHDTSGDSGDLGHSVPVQGVDSVADSGDSSRQEGKEERPEDIADSALKEYGLENVRMSEVVCWHVVLACCIGMLYWLKSGFTVVQCSPKCKCPIAVIVVLLCR